jgi:hypothetical protein
MCWWVLPIRISSTLIFLENEYDTCSPIYLVNIQTTNDAQPLLLTITPTKRHPLLS